MPERSPDPIRELENFDTGGLTVTPMDPAQVRRLGDRRRTRRNAGLVAASVVAVLAAASPVLLLSHRGGDAPSPAVLTSTPSPSSSPSAGPPKVITYPGTGVEVDKDADAQKLVGTSTDFQAYIADLARKLNAPGATCPEAYRGITVQKYSTAGYAIGGVSDCGGYVALWVKRDGVWQEGLGSQDVWDCDALGYLEVPRSFAGECANQGGDFGPEAVGDLRLGMDEAQVSAAGGTIQAGATGQCRGLLLPHQSPVPDQVDGWFSPTRGLVSINARPGMKTPERIGLGSSHAAVEAAYPGGRLANGYWVVPLTAGTEYEFGLEADGTVGEAMLTATDQDCFG